MQGLLRIVLCLCAFSQCASGSLTSGLGCPPAPVTVPLDDIAAALTDALVQVSARINVTIEAHPGTFASVGIVYRDQLFYSRSNVGDVNSSYRVASNTKVITSLLTFIARDLGVLVLDEPVVELQQLPSYPFSFRDLMSHRAGLQRQSPCQALLGRCNLTLPDAIEAASQVPPVYAADQHPSYSNLGFALLGHVVAQRLQLSYEQAVSKYIAGPLQMQGSGFPPQPAHFQLIPGLDSAGRKLPNYDYGFENPAGGMYASVADYGKLLAAFFDGHQFPFMREFMDPVWVGAGNFPLKALGMPWEMFFSYQGQPHWRREKSGSVYGYTSQLIVVEELKLGVVVLVSGGKYAGALASGITNLVVPALTAALQTRQPTPPVLPSVLQGSYFGSSAAYPPGWASVDAKITETHHLDLFYTDSGGTRRQFLGVGLEYDTELSNDDLIYCQTVSLKTVAQCSYGGTVGQWLIYNTTDSSFSLPGEFNGFFFTLNTTVPNY